VLIVGIRYGVIDELIDVYMPVNIAPTDDKVEGGTTSRNSMVNGKSASIPVDPNAMVSQIFDTS
jgi:hypothetical protein